MGGGDKEPLKQPQQTVFSICDLFPIPGEPRFVSRYQILTDTFVRKFSVMFY